MSGWGSSWGSTWGGSWGNVKPLDAAMQRAGVVRLWMYELYSESIEEDHKRRGLIKEIEAETKVEKVESEPVITVTKIKKKVSKRVKQVEVVRSKPTQPPVFVRNSANEDLISQINELLDDLQRSPFKLIDVSKPVRVDNVEVETEAFVELSKMVAVKIKRKREEEWLLLAA